MTFFNEREKFDYFIYEVALSIQTKKVKIFIPPRPPAHGDIKLVN
jgi:hypothetical protein